MTIAFLSNKSDGVVKVLRSIRDSLDLVGGRDLIDFLSETRERSEFFDRLVVSENALTTGSEEQDFLFLKEYIESYSPNLEVVMAISRESGSSLADLFTSIFSAPMYTVAYLPEKTSTSVLIEIVELPVLEVKAKYFSLDSGQVKSKELSNKTKESTKKSAKGKPKKKKKGWGIKSIFGGKSAEEPEEEEEVDDSSDNGESSGVPVAPTVSPVTPSPVDGLVAPAVASTVSGVSDSDVRESINKLFSGGTEEEVEESTGDLSLNFGEYGESHYQTGIIPEEDLESDNSSDDLVVNSTSNEDSGWHSVSEGNLASPFAEDPVSPDFSEFSEDKKPESPVEQELGTPIPDFSEDLLSKTGGILPTRGVSLVVGDESSQFIFQNLRGSSGYYILDTKKSLDLSSYIDESSYLSSDSEFYEEGGNYYMLNVPISSIGTLVSGKDKVIINASVDSLSSLESQLDLLEHIIPVFSSDIAKLESQMLEYEAISPRVARRVSTSSPTVIGGISQDVVSLLSRAVFSRINWKGLIK